MLLIHVDSITPSPTQPVLHLQTTTSPHPPLKLRTCFRPKNYSDLIDILLFLAFLFGMFISGGFFLQSYLRLTL